MNLIIENMAQIHNAGNLRAFCDVRIKTVEGDWVIRGCRIIQQSGQRVWFSFPTVSWQDGDGKIHYKTMLEVPAELKGEISEAALAAYQKLQPLAA